MLVGDKYKVESDSLNVILYRRRGKRKDEGTIWEIEGYFATVKNALQCLVDLEIRGTGLKDFQQVTEKQDELYRLIRSLTLPGEPSDVEVKVPASDYQAVVRASGRCQGCNTAQDKGNIPREGVTGHKKPDVTARIRELAAKGLSSRAISDVLRSEGRSLSHMTIARRLQDGAGTRCEHKVEANPRQTVSN